MNLGLLREQRDERGRHLLAEALDDLLALDRVHVLHQHLNGTKHDGRVGVLQTRGDTLADSLGFARVLRSVACQGVQNEDLRGVALLVVLMH